MSQVDQIRQEQEAQIAAPRKPYQSLVQALSNVFHPLLMLSYTSILICLITPFEVLPFQVKSFFVGLVVFYTLFLPILVITLLHSFHIIGHWALRDRRDRSIPFCANFICHLINAIVLDHYLFFPNWLMIPFYGAVVLTFVAWIVSFWWKISAHASADASLPTYFMMLYFIFPDFVPIWFPLVSIVIVGAVCSARIYLGRHTLGQISVGVVLGVVSMVLGYAYAYVL